MSWCGHLQGVISRGLRRSVNRSRLVHAREIAGAQAQGNPIGFADCAIAAIARAKGFAVATRNVRDFRGTDVEVIDPWAL